MGEPVGVEQVLDPQNVVETLWNARNQAAGRQLQLQVEVLLEQRGGEAAHCVRVAEVVADLRDGFRNKRIS